MGEQLHLDPQPHLGATTDLGAVAGRAITAGMSRTFGRTKRQSVLVVEDNALLAELADLLLRELGYDVIITRGPREALDMLTSVRFDLVFSDVVMPGGLSGFELARRIRAQLPMTLVLLTTGYGDAVAEIEAHEFPVLCKPYSMSELAAAIKALGMTSPSSVMR
ncbi:MAG: response regulator [Caulobacteraceae bacterium]|nr:response regulator [Caulobacteraceae bacterium]